MLKAPADIDIPLPLQLWKSPREKCEGLFFARERQLAPGRWTTKTGACQPRKRFRFRWKIACQHSGGVAGIPIGESFSMGGDTERHDAPLVNRLEARGDLIQGAIDRKGESRPLHGHDWR